MQRTIERLRSRRQGLKDQEGGFSLVELLVVIVILAILAAIIVFAVQNLQGKTAQASCQYDLATVDHAVQAYYATNNAYPSSIAELIAGPNPLLHNVPTNGTHYAVAMAQDVTAAAPFSQGHFPTSGTVPTPDGSIVVLSQGSGTPVTWGHSTAFTPSTAGAAAAGCTNVA
jgi:general secretion pathway protein G